MEIKKVLARLKASRWLTPAAILLVVLFWSLFLRSQIRTLRQYDWQIPPSALLWGMFWSVLYYLILAFCWTMLLRRMGGLLPVMRGMRLWLISMFTRYIPGNVWHIVTRIALAGQAGIERPQVLASATLEQGLTLVGALALCAITLPFWDAVQAPDVWLIALVPAGLLALHPALLGRLLAWVAWRFDRPYLAWHYSFGEVLVLVGGYMLAMVWSGVALYAVVRGLTSISLDQLPLFIGIAALAWVVGYLSFLTPSGLGVREGMVVLLLAQVIPLPAAIIGSLFYRLAITAGEVVITSTVWLVGKSL